MYIKQYRGEKNLPGNLRRDRKGSVLVEYALLIAGIALVAMVAISVLGHKTTDLIAMVATVLPGAHPGDNHPIQSGQLIETTITGDGAIAIDPAAIVAANGTSRLDANVLGNTGAVGLVLEVDGNLKK